MIAGLIASCASCMSFFLFEKTLFALYSAPNFDTIRSFAACFAASETRTESVLR